MIDAVDVTHQHSVARCTGRRRLGHSVSDEVADTLTFSLLRVQQQLDPLLATVHRFTDSDSTSPAGARDL